MSNKEALISDYTFLYEAAADLYASIGDTNHANPVIALGWLNLKQALKAAELSHGLHLKSGYEPIG